MVFKGNTSTSATSTAANTPSKIISFSIVNRSGSTANVTVSIISGSTNIAIYKGTISSGATYTDDVLRIIGSSATIYVLTDFNIDYYFSIT